MAHAGAGEMNHLPSGLPCPQAEVGILVVEKEALVEAAERIEQRAADEQERAHDLVDLAGLGMVEARS